MGHTHSKKTKNGFDEEIMLDLFFTNLGRFAYSRSYAGFVGSGNKIIFDSVCLLAKKRFKNVFLSYYFTLHFLHTLHTCIIVKSRNRTLYLPKKVFLDFYLYMYSKTIIIILFTCIF